MIQHQPFKSTIIQHLNLSFEYIHSSCNHALHLNFRFQVSGTLAC